MNRLFGILVVLSFYPVIAGWQCGPPLTQDPGFDLWCIDDSGEHVLCAWSVDIGQVRRVPTWHRSDYGVELVGELVEISQLVDVSFWNVHCLCFELLADRDAEAGLTLEMDFQDDGAVEYSHPILSNDFRSANYNITPPSWFSSVRFIIRKVGTGRAVLAQIKATEGGDCTEDHLDMRNRPDGAICEVDRQCESGRCYGASVEEGYYGVCGRCADDSDCLSGEVCGVEAGPGPDLWLYHGCGSAGRHLMGERCLGNLECVTGVCSENKCSECGNLVSCPPGSRCEFRDDFHLRSHQCSPGENVKESGTPCLFHDDCASGICDGEGELKVCFWDGETCDRDEDCAPFIIEEMEPKNTCVLVGIAGGECR